MHRLRFLLGLGLLLLTFGGGIRAQPAPVSPRESVAARIDGSDITIVYGRPYLRDPRTGVPRKIWGGLVPYGRVWRTGANEATSFTTTWDLEIGGRTLAAGSYSLYSIPEDRKGWLIFNRQTGQWGTERDEQQDVLRVEMTRESLRPPPVLQFTILIEAAAAGGVLRFRWEDAQYSVPFRVKR